MSQEVSSEGPARRYLLSRAPGILFALAALLVSFSGAATPALAPTDLVATEVPATPAPADPAPAAIAEAPVTAPAADAATAPELSFTTGTRLTPEQHAEFVAYIDALQAKGQHRGAAYYTSW